MLTYLEFETQLADLEGRIADLKALSLEQPTLSISKEISDLEKKAEKCLRDLYGSLDAWQKTHVARHPSRPHFLEYAAALLRDFTPLSGDRTFADDQAIIGGPAWLGSERVMVIGQEKGHDTTSRLKHNFGMAKPEGYRKAVRLMEMANHFSLPVITFVDTAGAYPGIGAEERGQSEAIARSTETGLSLDVPSLTIILGEGGSGGAIALAATNKIFMLEHAIYSVISPEGAASILWRDSARAREAALAMKITAQDLQTLGIIDGIIEEPLGGAHRDRQKIIADVGEVIANTLKEFEGVPGTTLKKQRREKFLAIGRSLT